MTAYDDQNIFAKILRGEMPAVKVHEDADTLTFMDIMPRAEGHCLVIPKSPGRHLLDTDAEAVTAVARTTQKIAAAAMKAFNADGITVHQHNEAAAGQEVFHYHVHVIPRFDGQALKPHDGKMADADSLESNAQKLREALQAG